MISLDGLYRYELRREWDPRLPPLICIMLNPSTADAHNNDATVARLIRRAATLGFGSLIIGNLGAGRATHPRVWAAMRDPIGPDNLRTLVRIMREARERGGRVMVGWGAQGPPDLVRYVVNKARCVGVKLYCLGVTVTGHPRHPLRVAYSVALERWEPNDETSAAKREAGSYR